MLKISVKPLLPHEPRIIDELTQQKLTEAYLLPALAELETFFLTIRAKVDAVLQPLQPFKLGKPYPLGQCLEITQAVHEHLGRRDISGFDGLAAVGHSALMAFLRVGGSLRQVWGDLRGQFFQNAFLIGTLYVDVSNDTVVPTKPKVEILPFGKSQLTPVKDYRHFKRLAECYWQHQVFPNHVLPQLAPYCPLIHINPSGQVRLHDATSYMIDMTRATGFQASEDVLRMPAVPVELFSFVASAMQSSKLKIADNPEQGRIDALKNCQMYRAKRWHRSAQQRNRIVNSLYEANDRLTKVAVQASGAIQGQRADDDINRVDYRLAVPTTLPMTTSYVLLSKERHGNRRLQHHPSYHFAAHEALTPLTVQELPQAMMALPVALIVSGEGFDLVAVQGLMLNRNAFVASDGRWLAGYLPAAYRSYPFKLVSADNGQHVLCIDENSGLVTEGPNGERFFEDDGNLAQAVTDVLNFLAQQQTLRNVTANICAELQKHKLIQPWPITVHVEGRMQNIEGLYRIDEAALNALPAQAAIELRDTGALAAAYCQLLSMQNIQKLG